MTRSTINDAADAAAAGLDVVARTHAIPVARMRSAERTGSPKQPAIELVGSSAIFAPLPEPKWISDGLMMGPGRPTLIVAYGATGKTLALQSLALSAVTGNPIWDHFPVKQPMRVVHLDYEQGSYATFRRYQRLAFGHRFELADIGDRLLVAAMPGVYLTSDRAYEAFARVSEGNDLVIIDSFRAAAPGVDENDSKVRQFLDLLTRLSGSTGAAYIVIHHAGKPKEGQRDERAQARGSSGIFDASGCVLQLTRQRDEPLVKVTMSKQPAEGAGGAVEQFGLAIEDVPFGGNPTAGVRVVARLGVSQGSPMQPDKNAAQVLCLLRAIAAHPGLTANQLVEHAGIGRADALRTLRGMVRDGVVVVRPGPRNASHYYPAGHDVAND